MWYDVSMIIQAYMGWTLYESIVHDDVLFPVNFDKTVEFRIYDSGDGRWYRVPEFELQSNGRPRPSDSILSGSGGWNVQDNETMI